MIEINMESRLKEDENVLSDEVLSIGGVNYELGPALKMGAPEIWQHTSIADWPEGRFLFNSVVWFLKVIPIDVHFFKMINVSKLGFEEASSTLLNKKWCHERTIESSDDGTIIRDQIRYQSRIPLVGNILKPIYSMIFKHRHSRLVHRYGA